MLLFAVFFVYSQFSIFAYQILTDIPMCFSKNKLAFCASFLFSLCSFMQVKSQQNRLPTDAELFTIAKKYISSPITKIEKPNGEIWFQRNVSDYLQSVQHAQDAIQQDTDFGHDHAIDDLVEFLNRPHPAVATLEKYFSSSASEFGVPVNLLKAYAQIQSNWTQVSQSMYGSWGIMGLVENDKVKQISLAANLIKSSPETIRNDAYTHIRAAAALLAYYQKPYGAPQKTEDWFESTCLLTGFPERYLQESLVKRVFSTMEKGVKTISLWEEIIYLAPDDKVSVPEPVPSKVREDAIQLQGNGVPDYPNAIYNLTTCNFNNRPAGATIRYYFVHYIAVGTYEGTISWFKNCSAQASAHYVVRNSDGQVTQMVDEANRAWSQGVTEYNDQGIGVEHDVIAANLAMWDNANMLREAGKLAADVCNRNNIPKQRRVNNGEPGIYGHSDVRATDCPNLTPERWTTLLNNITGAVPSVGTPTLFSVEAIAGSSQITATWKANTEPSLLGYRLYYATSEALVQWKLAANETTLPPGTTSITLQPNQFVEVPTEPVYHFRLTAVVPNGSNPVVESSPGDVYSRSSGTTGPKVLIVDGFDRMGGSYKLPAHAFTTNYFKAIRDRALVTISSVANEKVEDGTVSLQNYDIVVWYVGDESSADVVFSTAEKNAIIQFLNNGGKLLVTGSEVGYNIGRTGAAGLDLSFMNNYLKANYTHDGASTFSPATGIAGTPFEGLNIPFGIVYPEDFPDAMTPTGGAVALMNYAVSPHRAAIGFKGTFGGNPNAGALVYAGFTLETANDPAIGEFIARTLSYFDISVLTAPPIANPDFSTTRSGNSKRINVVANDLGNGGIINPASVSITDQPIQGKVTVNTNGTVLYSANPGYVGLDSFYYRVANTQGSWSNVAKVRVQVLAGGSGDCSPEFTEVDDEFPLRSLRGAWITSVFNLDWPTSRTASPAAQRAQLISQLDMLKNAGFNTVFLQVRTGSDALYQSAHEPWSFYLTGTEGLAPNPLWDPLAFAVDAAHERGLELHAWINPYRARTGSYTLAPNHLINTQPSWILTIGTNLILNPGLPDVRNYITMISADIANRYDVDGIHFDDYFYPSAITNQDAATFAAHNPGGFNNIGDWRRDNVNRMIANVYDTLQKINAATGRNIIFGVSPFGIWKSGTPPGITGQSSFSALFCDPIAWLQQGKVDYLAPQLYWRITGPQDYNILSQWWNDQSKQYGRPIYFGQAWYKMVDANNWPASEIENQIILNRLPVRDATRGEIGYRLGQLVDNSKGLRTALQQGLYRFKSYVPPYPGKDNICPNAPTNLRFDGDTLRWDAPAPASDGDLARKYVVYRFTNEQEALQLENDGTKVLDIVSGNRIRIPANPFERFVVTALDKNNNESLGAISPMPDVMLCVNGGTQLPAMVSGNTYQWQRRNSETWEVLPADGNFSGTQTATLSIQNLPVSFYGLQVRCVANNQDTGPVYTLRFGSVWTGGVNNRWDVAENWSCGSVPTLQTDAIIRMGVVNFPLIDVPHAEARRVVVHTGAQVNMVPGMKLTVGQQ